MGRGKPKRAGGVKGIKKLMEEGIWKRIEMNGST